MIFNQLIFSFLYVNIFMYSIFIRGCKGFDVGLELEVARRVTLGHVKTGELLK